MSSTYIYRCVKCRSMFNTHNRDLESSPCPNCESELTPFEVVNNADKKDKLSFSKYRCVNCGHLDKVTSSKKDYQEVIPCPKCSSFFVDVWATGKYNLVSEKKEAKISVNVNFNNKEVVDRLAAEIQQRIKKCFYQEWSNDYS